MDKLLLKLRQNMAELSLQGDDFTRQIWQMYATFEEFIDHQQQTTGDVPPTSVGGTAGSPLLREGGASGLGNSPDDSNVPPPAPSGGLGTSPPKRDVLRLEPTNLNTVIGTPTSGSLPTSAATSTTPTSFSAAKETMATLAPSFPSAHLTTASTPLETSSSSRQRTRLPRGDAPSPSRTARDDLSLASPRRRRRPRKLRRSVDNPLLDTISAIEDCESDEYSELPGAYARLHPETDSIGYAGSNSIDSGYKSACPTPELTDGLYGHEKLEKRGSIASLGSTGSSGGSGGKPRIAMGTRVMARGLPKSPSSGSAIRRPGSDGNYDLDQLMYLRQSLLMSPPPSSQQFPSPASGPGEVRNPGFSRYSPRSSPSPFTPRTISPGTVAGATTTSEASAAAAASGTTPHGRPSSPLPRRTSPARSHSPEPRPRSASTGSRTSPAPRSRRGLRSGSPLMGSTGSLPRAASPHRRPRTLSPALREDTRPPTSSRHSSPGVGPSGRLRYSPGGPGGGRPPSPIVGDAGDGLAMLEQEIDALLYGRQGSHFEGLLRNRTSSSSSANQSDAGAVEYYDLESVEEFPCSYVTMIEDKYRPAVAKVKRLRGQSAVSGRRGKQRRSRAEMRQSPQSNWREPQHRRGSPLCWKGPPPPSPNLPSPQDSVSLRSLGGTQTGTSLVPTVCLSSSNKGECSASSCRLPHSPVLPCCYNLSCCDSDYGLECGSPSSTSSPSSSQMALCMRALLDTLPSSCDPSPQHHPPATHRAFGVDSACVRLPDTTHQPPGASSCSSASTCSSLYSEGNAKGLITEVTGTSSSSEHLHYHQRSQLYHYHHHHHHQYHNNNTNNHQQQLQQQQQKQLQHISHLKQCQWSTSSSPSKTFRCSNEVVVPPVSSSSSSFVSRHVISPTSDASGSVDSKTLRPCHSSLDNNNQDDTVSECSYNSASLADYHLYEEILYELAPPVKPESRSATPPPLPARPANLLKPDALTPMRQAMTLQPPSQPPPQPPQSNSSATQPRPEAPPSKEVPTSTPRSFPPEKTCMASLESLHKIVHVTGNCDCAAARQNLQSHVASPPLPPPKPPEAQYMPHMGRPLLATFHPPPLPVKSNRKPIPPPKPIFKESGPVSIKTQANSASSCQTHGGTPCTAQKTSGGVSSDASNGVCGSEGAFQLVLSSQEGSFSQSAKSEKEDQSYPKSVNRRSNLYSIFRDRDDRRCISASLEQEYRGAGITSVTSPASHSYQQHQACKQQTPAKPKEMQEQRLQEDQEKKQTDQRPSEQKQQDQQHQRHRLQDQRLKEQRLQEQKHLDHRLQEKALQEQLLQEQRLHGQQKQLDKRHKEQRPQAQQLHQEHLSKEQRHREQRQQQQQQQQEKEPAHHLAATFPCGKVAATLSNASKDALTRNQEDDYGFRVAVQDV